jgi:Outer membrane protein beta-barrel domain
MVMHSKSKFLIVSFLLIFVLGLIANLAMAQDSSTTYSTTTTTTESSTNSTARAGIKGGLNVSNWYVDDVDDENARFGFNVGLYAQLFSSEVFAIQPELLYSTKGTRTTYDNGIFEGDIKYNFNYLEVPVLAVIKLGTAAELQFGPYWSYLLAANIDVDGDVDTFDELDRDNFQSWDFGLAGGVGLNFGSTQIGVRYSKGLRKLADSDNARALVGDAKNSCAQLYIAFSM